MSVTPTYLELFTGEQKKRRRRQVLIRIGVGIAAVTLPVIVAFVVVGLLLEAL